MSILIKDMKMPEHCGQCFAYDTTYQVCNLYFMGIPNRMTSLEHRPEWCELVELPPHGRLIDAGELERKIGENIDKAKSMGQGAYGWWYACNVAEDFVLSAPTIIPAEEGET